MRKGRQADSARRRQRVTAAISKACADGTEISVSAIARAASVDRTFIYRHRDSSPRSTPSKPPRPQQAKAHTAPP
jgi:hypothetical protein